MCEICKICGSEEIKEEYTGIIRDGGLGKYTDKPVTMYRCLNCGVIWHSPLIDTRSYYENDSYRMSLEDTVEEADFYRLHDCESLDKFRYTGMIFRDKICADIGCGAGAFLDLVRGAAKDVIAVEPTKQYGEILRRKGFHTYAYGQNALSEWAEKIDVITSFDVIEHVDDPIKFLEEIYLLLAKMGGVCDRNTHRDSGDAKIIRVCI